MSIFHEGARLVTDIVTEAEEQRILMRIAQLRPGSAISAAGCSTTGSGTTTAPAHRVVMPPRPPSRGGPR